MERQFANRKRGYDAAERHGPSVKKCHVISRVMTMTLDIRQVGAVGPTSEEKPRSQKRDLGHPLIVWRVPA
jgi:hypothetical protein